MNIQNQKQIVGWAVVYVPTFRGKTFANLKSETIAAFHDQDDAINLCHSENMNGYIDELHSGYKVYPMYWIPKGITLK